MVVAVVGTETAALGRSRAHLLVLVVSIAVPALAACVAWWLGIDALALILAGGALAGPITTWRRAAALTRDGWIAPAVLAAVELVALAATVVSVAMIAGSISSPYGQTDVLGTLAGSVVFTILVVVFAAALGLPVAVPTAVVAGLVIRRLAALGPEAATWLAWLLLATVVVLAGVTFAVRAGGLASVAPELRPVDWTEALAAVRLTVTVENRSRDEQGLEVGWEFEGGSSGSLASVPACTAVHRSLRRRRSRLVRRPRRPPRRHGIGRPPGHERTGMAGWQCRDHRPRDRGRLHDRPSRRRRPPGRRAAADRLRLKAPLGRRRPGRRLPAPPGTSGPSTHGPRWCTIRGRMPGIRAPIGRERELAELADLLAVPGALPAAVLVEGEAGMGKTTLWLAGVATARDRGFAVLEARPVEAETGLSYSGLADLLEPIVDHVLPRLPGPQRAALEGALLLRPADDAPLDRRAVATAALGALRGTAGRGPLLIAVDDVQWLDAASGAVLGFALRRLRSEPVAGLFAARTGPGDGATGAWAGWLRTTVLPVGPLSLGATHALAFATGSGAALPRPQPPAPHWRCRAATRS